MILDLFSGGASGWCHAARALGMDPVGIELDASACALRAATGLATIRADVSTYPLDHLPEVTGLIGSPPCPDFSAAGKRAGLKGKSGPLVYEPLRWARALRPEWIACEQVKEVLPIWRQTADELRTMGYSAWCGVLDAASYGTPQHRRRAILMAWAVYGPHSAAGGSAASTRWWR
jgi:DNA (cytosine-5)-methyltransferase 1